MSIAGYRRGTRSLMKSGWGISVAVRAATGRPNGLHYVLSKSAVYVLDSPRTSDASTFSSASEKKIRFDHALVSGAVSLRRRAATSPDAPVIMAITHIAPASPNRSAMTPASTAPKA